MPILTDLQSFVHSMLQTSHVLLGFADASFAPLALCVALLTFTPVLVIFSALNAWRVTWKQDPVAEPRQLGIKG